MINSCVPAGSVNDSVSDLAHNPEDDQKEEPTPICIAWRGHLQVSQGTKANELLDLLKSVQQDKTVMGFSFSESQLEGDSAEALMARNAKSGDQHANFSASKHARGFLCLILISAGNC